MAFLRTTLLLGLLTGIFLALGYFLAGTTGALVGLVFAFFTNFISYWFSDKIVLHMYGAQPLKNEKVMAMIKKIAQKANMPMPKAYLINMDVPNAFATGRSPKNAAVAVTQKLLDTLSDKEVEAVLGHELSHVKNRDTLISTIAATMAGALTFIAYSAMFSRNENRGMGLLAAIVVPIAGSLISLAITRGREFAADKTGAELTNPLDLASALQKIAGSGSSKMQGNTATSHLFIVNPFSAASVGHLFSTHPPTEERVKRLRSMRGLI